MFFPAQLLGFENFIPPFATARREEIVRGVNYASGAAGIRDETAEHMVYFHYIILHYACLPTN